MHNPIWLRSFIAVAHSGSFTRAAEALDLTQAAVSQHLQRLEAQYGLLLIRRPRQLELTPRGRILLEFALEQEQALQRLQSALSDDDAEQGALRLATPGSSGLLLYPLLLEQQQRFPGLTLQHRFAPTAEIIAAVLESRVDIGLITEPVSDPRLERVPFASEPLCLVLPAAATGSSWNDLMQLGFIDHPDGQHMARRLLARLHPGERVDALPQRGFTNQISLILEPVARGLGFTVLPHFAVAAFANQQAIRIETGTPAILDTLYLIHRAEWPLAARYRRLLPLLQARLQNQTGTLQAGSPP